MIRVMPPIALVLVSLFAGPLANGDECWCWNGVKAPLSLEFVVGTWNGKACVDTKFHSAVKFTDGTKFYSELASLVASRKYYEVGSRSCPLES